MTLIHERVTVSRQPILGPTDVFEVQRTILRSAPREISGSVAKERDTPMANARLSKMLSLAARVCIGPTSQQI